MRAVILACAIVLMGASSCQHQIPIWDGRLYIGVPEHSAIERAQDPSDPIIYANEERFRGYMCMSPADFDSFIKIYVMGCKDWGGAPTEKAGTIYQSVMPK